MVDLTRRKTVIGLGLLATGSGATFTSAAFQSSTQQDSDLRVVVDQNLQFGANPDLDPDDVDNITDNPDFFNDGELDEDGGAFDDGNETDNPSFNETNESGVGNESNIGEGGFDPDNPNDDGGFNEGFEPGLPKAFAGEVGDGDFAIRAAVQIGESATFEELLRVSNATDSPVEIGIGYNRDGIGNGSNGNYGADVDPDGGNSTLNARKAQKIYQFHTSDDAPNSDNDSDSSQADKLISPDPDGNNTGNGSSDNGFNFNNSNDAPNKLVTLDPGEFVNLDLVVNASNDNGVSKRSGSEDIAVEQDILDVADIDQGAFGFQTDTVQIMDVITVVSRPA